MDSIYDLVMFALGTAYLLLKLFDMVTAAAYYTVMLLRALKFFAVVN